MAKSTAKKKATANLVIMESPSKANTVKGYLGSGYRVVASNGHIRDLPKSTLGVDIENHFQARYINIRGKGPLIRELKKEAKAADRVYLATDPDREGEAIAWHLAAALDLDENKTRRITFNEVTKHVVRDAIKHPRAIDMNLVNSQQARRILDRIVGYKLSPFLWKTVKSGLSAGRVQSAATRVIVDRENEIRAFVPEEYFTIELTLEDPHGKVLHARFWGDQNGKIALKEKTQTDQVLQSVKDKDFTVSSMKKTVKQKHPTPPFITSTLQQEASKKLGFQSQRIMKIAQELYEGINLGEENGGVQGLITYMRTDSLRISEEAQTAAKALILSQYGEQYYPAQPRVYKTKSNAQDAHEAIRPANLKFSPEQIKKYLSSEQYKLYRLIWNRFVASQMANAQLNTVTVDFQAPDSPYLFRSSGYVVAFKGYMAVYEESEDEPDEDAPQKSTKLPDLKEGEVCHTVKVDPQSHFTEPPARYTEASLIKFFEEKGIARPSTYTPIITTIIARGYVVRDGKSLRPTELGEVTNKLMLEYFPDIVDETFTAHMEDQLDDIEKGQTTPEQVLTDFYKGFETDLENAEKHAPHETVETPVEQTDLICEKCGSRMVVKNGRYGKFAACPNYPTCKNTKPLNAPENTVQTITPVEGMKCELCGGNMVLRPGKYGNFYACEHYPQCRYTRQVYKEIGVTCPKCGGQLIQKRGRNRMVFYSCENYPKCDFSSWDLPLNETCPNCGKMLFRKKGKNYIYCADKACGYKREIAPNTDEDLIDTANEKIANGKKADIDTTTQA